MKNLKKLLALVLSLAMMVTTFTLPAFAADDATEDNTEATETAEAAVEEPTNAEICFALEVLKGEGHGLTEEYLAKEAPRWNIALMTVRLRGLEDEAMAYDGEDTFADADKMTWVAGRPFLGYLKANPELGWLGRGTDDLFDPEGMMTVQEYYKAMLQVLGYDQGTDFEWAEVMDKAEEVGIAAAGDAEKLTNSIIGDVTVAALKAETKDGKVLAEKLVELGTIDEEVAAKYELVKIAPDAVAVKSAVALDSKIVEVELDEATEETNAAQFVITDEDDEIVEVESAELAAWDADKKTVLVTLADDLKSGGLYKLVSGDAETKFGGRSTDETKPEVVKVESTDYNEITIEFNEAIVLDTLEVEVSKRTEKKTIEVLDMAYSDSNKVVLTTEEQGKRMNLVKIKGATDLAGNKMDSVDKTCNGKEMPDDPMRVENAFANDYNEVAIEFDQRVGDLDASMFTIYERGHKNDTKEVLDARPATEDDYFGKEQIKDLGNDDPKKYVILEVEDLGSKKMFTLEVKDLESLYGNNVDSDHDTDSFNGKQKPDEPFDLTKAEATSNTEVTLTFENKVNEETATDVSLYTVSLRGKSDDTLEVTEVEVDDYKVILTVESMISKMYNVEVDNDIMDIYGNKVDSDKDNTSFRGQKIADKIKKIVSIERVKDNDNQIRVAFDQNVGDNAEDVALYKINKDVGYPIKVEKDDDNNKVVILTIPKTDSGRTYTLAVAKGLENNDGIVSTDKLEKYFSGRGYASKLPEVEYADVQDSQTMYIGFDRDVTESTILGKIYNDDHEIIPGALKLDVNGDGKYRSADGDIDLADRKYAAYAYQSPDEDSEQVLVIRFNDDLFKEENSDTDDSYSFNLIVKESLVTEDENIAPMSYSDDDPEAPEIIDVYTVSDNTIEMMFSEPISLPDTLDNTKMYLRKTKSGSMHLQLGNYYAVDDTTYRFAIEDKEGNPTTFSDDDFDNDDTAYLYVKDGYIKDISGTVGIEDEDHDYILMSISQDYDETEAITADDIDANIINNMTIDIAFFNEVMNEDHVIDSANYELLDKNYNAISGGVEIRDDYATYDDDENIVKLYLNKSIKNASSVKYLAIKSSVENKLGSNHVDDDRTIKFDGVDAKGIVLEVGYDDDDPADPEIASCKVQDDRYSIVVGFNEDVYLDTTTTDDGVDADAFKTSFATVTKANILNALNIYAQFEDETDDDKVLTTEINKVANVSNSNYKKIEIFFTKQLEEGSAGEVNVAGATVPFKSRAGATIDSDAQMPFSVDETLYSDVATVAEKVTELEKAVETLKEHANDSDKLDAAVNARTAANDAVDTLENNSPDRKDFEDRIEVASDKIDTYDVKTATSLVVKLEEATDTDVDLTDETNFNKAVAAYKAANDFVGELHEDVKTTKDLLQGRIDTCKEEIDKYDVEEAKKLVDELEKATTDVDLTDNTKFEKAEDAYEAANDFVGKLEVTEKTTLQTSIDACKAVIDSYDVEEAKSLVEELEKATADGVDLTDDTLLGTAKDALTAAKTFVGKLNDKVSDKVDLNKRVTAAETKITEATTPSVDDGESPAGEVEPTESTGDAVTE